MNQELTEVYNIPSKEGEPKKKIHLFRDCRTLKRSINVETINIDLSNTNINDICKVCGKNEINFHFLPRHFTEEKDFQNSYNQQIKNDNLYSSNLVIKNYYNINETMQKSCSECSVSNFLLNTTKEIAKIDTFTIESKINHMIQGRKHQITYENNITINSKPNLFQEHSCQTEDKLNIHSFQETFSIIHNQINENEKKIYKFNIEKIKLPIIGNEVTESLFPFSYINYRQHFLMIKISSVLKKEGTKTKLLNEIYPYVNHNKVDKKNIMHNLQSGYINSNEEKKTGFIYDEIN